MPATAPPLVAHVVHALRVGGLENGVVNLINRMPAERFRHAIVCLTDHDDFANRITRPGVPVIDLHKRPGHDLGLYRRLWQTFRALRPAIVHTRNLATLEAQIPALLAGVPARVHGEHGWDVENLDGANRRHLWLRRLHRPLVHRYIALSRHIEAYLRRDVGVRPERIAHICNGVDTDRFRPAGARALGPNEAPPVGAAPRPDQGTEQGSYRPLPGSGFPLDAVVIGTVGRMEPVKDPLNLVRAFLLLLDQRPEWRARLRLAMIGSGSRYDEVRATLRAANAEDLAWLPGARADTAPLYRGMDLFVLPSLAEGISNTILEAMASGLPVVATNVGGSPELILDGETGALVPRADPVALASAIARYAADAELRRRHAGAARERACSEFSLDQMVNHYLAVYDTVCDSSDLRHGIRRLVNNL